MTNYLVHEDPLIFGEYTFIARRNEGEKRWQVFADDAFAPVGFIEQWFDPDIGQDQLFVYDARNVRIGEESVHSYKNALSHIRMRLLGLA